MSELSAGQEMDLAVAKACGIDARFQRSYVTDEGASSNVIVRYGADCRPEGELFEPSTNVRTAFETAEKIGLFDPANNVTMWKMPYGFRVAFDKPNGPAFTRSTPAEAICRAILRLKGASDER